MGDFITFQSALSSFKLSGWVGGLGFIIVRLTVLTNKFILCNSYMGVSLDISALCRYSAAYATVRELMLEPRDGYPPSRRRVAAGDALAGVRERFFESLS